MLNIKKTRTKKLIDAIENTQPITEKALVASGITAAGAPKPKRIRVKKVKGGDFNDVLSKVKGVASTVGDVVKTAATVAPYVLPLVGLGKEKKPRKPSEWNTLVSKIRTEKGLSLKDAMKHIKENNLYQKIRGVCSFSPLARKRRCDNKRRNANNHAKNGERKIIKI